ncbi:arsenate reductase family protein [Paenibacillus sp.]|uniref:arsenate reductase family protein n=1 Tax=Paenibacillus sp. TaxID=58172 RepID=UPI002D369103|nr:arsenate reductase family protein [Paenibacillus sp.]HZG55207.1 arsenate reductase family protein [Paenibacillus sp.]
MNQSSMTAYLYPKCSTCRDAMKSLAAKGIQPERVVNVFETPPSKEELRELWRRSGLPLKKFMNTSGEAYKEMNLKDKLPHMSEDDVLELLASNGRLIKRPIVTDGERVTVGYKEAEYAEVWS